MKLLGKMRRDAGEQTLLLCAVLTSSASFAAGLPLQGQASTSDTDASAALDAGDTFTLYDLAFGFEYELAVHDEDALHVWLAGEGETISGMKPAFAIYRKGDASLVMGIPPEPLGSGVVYSFGLSGDLLDGAFVNTKKQALFPTGHGLASMCVGGSCAEASKLPAPRGGALYGVAGESVSAGVNWRRYLQTPGYSLSLFDVENNSAYNFQALDEDATYIWWEGTVDLAQETRDAFAILDKKMLSLALGVRPSDSGPGYFMNLQMTSPSLFRGAWSNTAYDGDDPPLHGEVTLCIRSLCGSVASADVDEDAPMPGSGRLMLSDPRVEPGKQEQ